MRVAFLNQPITPIRFPVAGDSMGLWHQRVATEWARDDVAVVYSRAARGESRVQERDGVVYCELPGTPGPGLERLATWATRLGEHLGRAPDPLRPGFAARHHRRDYALRAARDASSRGLEAVVITNYSQFAPVVRAAHPKARILLHMQCYWLSQLDARWIEPRLQAADLISGCSRDVAEAVARRFPQHAHKCFGLHNGVDVDRFTPAAAADDAARPPVFLFVGRVSPEKGLHVLLEAFRRVARRHEDVRLRIVGPEAVPPPEFVVALDAEPEVRELVRFYDDSRSYTDQLLEIAGPEIEKRVDFDREIHNDALPDVYRESTALVFPSIWHEPFGIPNVEAMACGVPVVATRSGGIPEIVRHGETGLLVERGDAEGLANAMLTLLEDRSRREAMGRAGREEAVRSFSWSRVAERLRERLEP